MLVVDSDDTAVGPVHGTEGIINKAIAQLRKLIPEIPYPLWFYSNFGAVWLFDVAHLLSMESHILAQKYLILAVLHPAQYVRTHAIFQEGDLALQIFLQLRHNWLERQFGNPHSVRPPHMRDHHQ